MDYFETSEKVANGRAKMGLGILSLFQRSHFMNRILPDILNFDRIDRIYGLNRFCSTPLFS